MKNIAIIVLVCAIGVLAYIQFVKNDSSGSGLSTNNSGATSTSTEKPKTSGGATIDLSNKGLDAVPKNILDNSSVTTFNVSDNNLTGALPAKIRKLTNLEVLLASGNKMTGIPAELGQLRKLKVANFANNNISGLPVEIGNLSNLETLDLRGNPKLSKQDLSRIQAKIPNAKILTD